jgi:Tripartite tricarboxylate transporter family receptor
MKLPRRQFPHLSVGAAGLPAASRIVEAQAYPSRPITMVVPFAPGGATDTIGRTIAERMKRSLGQPVIVENATGAGGTIGWLNWGKRFSRAKSRHQRRLAHFRKPRLRSGGRSSRRRTSRGSKPVAAMTSSIIPAGSDFGFGSKAVSLAQERCGGSTVQSGRDLRRREVAPAPIGDTAPL